MPALQEHQLRVAAVAQLISDNFTQPVDATSTVTTCLLHDIGNIIKFNLSYFPEFVEPEGLSYWEKVRADYVEKYGGDEHLATKHIVQELGFETHLLDEIGFSSAQKAAANPSFEQKICCYADQRVGPMGVVSIQERLKEGSQRYKDHPKSLNDNFFMAASEAWIDIEQQIFNKCRISPEDINDISIQPTIKSLRYYEVSES